MKKSRLGPGSAERLAQAEFNEALLSIEMLMEDLKRCAILYSRRMHYWRQRLMEKS